MKAIVKTGPTAGFEMVYVPIPPVGKNEVLIKVWVASICGTDLHVYQWDNWAKERINEFPRIVGHEFSGKVEAVGENVKSVEFGDMVSAETHIFCGTCPTCLERKFHLCQNTKLIGIDRSGCFAEYIVLPERVIWKNDPRLHPQLASIQEPLGNAVYCALVEDISAKTVAIFGDGPAGLFTSEIARVSGAKEIYVIGAEEYRLDIAKKLGAKTINANLVEPVNYILEATSGLGVDVSLEMSGAPTAIENSVFVAKKGGRVCAFGINPYLLARIHWNHIIFSGLTLYGIHGRIIFDTWIKVKDLLQSGKLNLWPIITHRFSMDRYEEAFQLSASRKCGKIILFP